MRPPFPSRRCEKNRSRSRERAPFTTADVGDAQRCQPAARETREIRLPSAARVGAESAAAPLIGRDERGAHVLADFEMLGARSPGPSHAVSCAPGTPIAATVLLEHAGGESTPAGVRGRDDSRRRGWQTAPADNPRP